jgi:hypothetical protein
MKNETYVSFAGEHLVASGDLSTMLTLTKKYLDAGGAAVLIFDDQSGRQLDFDFRGTIAEVVARAMPESPKPGPGRPKLGVVSAEVSLLPRHWEWLALQPAKVSGTLRRIVEAAMKDPLQDNRKKVDAIGSFMWTMAGNLVNFEEASRALYARDWPKFKVLTAQWPRDISNYLSKKIDGLDE